MGGRRGRWRLTIVPLFVFASVSAGTVGIRMLFHRLEGDASRVRSEVTAEQLATRIEEYVRIRLDLIQHLRGHWQRGEIEDRTLLPDHAQDLQPYFGGVVSIQLIDVEGRVLSFVPSAAKSRDLAQHPLAGPVLRRAREDGALRLTPPLELDHGGRGFAAYLPLYRDGVLRGFLNPIFRLKPLVEDCLARGSQEPLILEIRDEGTLAYAYSGSTGKAAPLFVSSRRFQVGDRTWEIAVAPKPDRVEQALSVRHDAALAAGLLLAVGLSWLSYRLVASRHALRGSQEQYRRIVEDLPDLVCRSLPDTTITFVNEEYARCSGKSREQLVGVSLLDPVPAEEHSAVLRHIDSLCRESPVRTIEHRVVTPDGETRWQRWRDRALFDADGTITEIQSIGIDTTERRKGEQALRDSEARFRTIFNSVTDAIYIFDRHGTVQDVNAKACDLHGYDRREMLCRDLASLSAEAPDAMKERFARLGPDNATPWRFEWEARHSSGRPWCADLHMELTQIDGEERILAVARDITERKKLETQLRQAQKLEAVGTLAAGVAHDFNNILTAVLGHADMARESLPEESEAYLALAGISAACAQGAGLTKSLLTFSRSASAEMIEVDLGQLVAETVQMLHPILPAAIEVQAEVPSLPHLWVSADRTQLQQVLMNLAVNARDAMPLGGRLRITVEHRPAEAGGEAHGDPAAGYGSAVLVVEDNGIGMAEEVRTRVVEPFFTTKPRERGTGLGMAVVHGILAEHKGLLAIESTRGLGTRVTVTLRCCAAPPAPLAPPAELERRDALGETVLVVEDNEQVRRLAVDSLRSSGFVTVEASDGLEALRLFEAAGSRIRLLVLDVDLPKMSGTACLREVRRRSPHVPAILISGLPLSELAESRLPAVTFLQKPFPMSKLARVAGQMLVGAGVRRR